MRRIYQSVLVYLVGCSAPPLTHQKSDPPIRVVAPGETPTPTSTSAPTSISASRPKLSVGVASVFAIDKATLKRQLKKEAKQPLIACYQEQLRRDPSWEGEMKIKLRVGSNGKVLFATPIKGPKRFTSCVRDVFLGLNIIAPYNCGVAQADIALRWSK